MCDEDLLYQQVRFKQLGNMTDENQLSKIISLTIFDEMGSDYEHYALGFENLE